MALLLGAVLLLPNTGHGQAFEQRVAPFPVQDSTGSTYAVPFLGGLNTPRPQLADLDGDDDLDLFLQERRNRLIYFENTGTSAAPQFEWRTDRFQDLRIGAWFRFGDLDGDGLLDLLTEEPTSTIRYYRNDGTATIPDFVQAEGPLRDTEGDAISADRQNVPGLAALDCSGPPDLLLGSLNGRLRYYEHTGTRNDGIPTFQKVADEYQDICVGPENVCGDRASGTRPQTTARHGANALATGDLGGDDDPDVLWGDFFSDSLYFIENTGSCAADSLERVADTYPPSAPVETAGYNVPTLGDLDGDDDLDLLVGVLGGSGTGSSAVKNLLHFENTGTDAQPSYTLRTDRFLRTLDVGGVSTPALADLDGDGDRDLVVGNGQEPGMDAARLHWFENVGTSAAPAFRHRPAPLLPTADAGFNFVPAFADVDDDGDPDLLLGTFSGTVRFYRNTGTAASPQFEREPDGDVELEQGNYATPALVDVDADGDQDLFVGSSSAEGTVSFYRNEGTARAPDFRFVTDSYKDIRAGERRTHPAFGDRDEDGAPDLYLGTSSGIAVYENSGTPDDAAFESPPDSVRLPFRSLTAPALADVDGDDHTDLLTGGEGGGIKYFKGQPRVQDSTPPGRPSNFRVADVTPDATTLRWTAPGDDGTSGTAARYVLRRRTGTPFRSKADFADSQRISEVPSPQPAGTAQSVTVSLPPDTSHFFALVARDEQGNSSPLAATAQDATPVATLRLLRPPSPNPTRTRSTVQFVVAERQTVRAELYDTLGRRLRVLLHRNVRAFRRQTLTADLSTLSSGVYFLRVQGQSATRTARIAVMR